MLVMAIWVLMPNLFAQAGPINRTLADSYHDLHKAWDGTLASLKALNLSGDSVEQHGVDVLTQNLKMWVLGIGAVGALEVREWSLVVFKV